MSEQMTVRVHFIDGTTRIVPAQDIHWKGEEGARSGTALVDGRETPVYNRSDWPDPGLWEEQMETHPGVCLECERDVEILSPAGLCIGCMLEEQGQYNDGWSEILAMRGY